MITHTITQEEAGRKLSRFLEKLLPKAPRSLFFKAVRHNKIRVNNRHPKDLSLILEAGDEVRLYYTEDELVSFGYGAVSQKNNQKPLPAVPVLYEDEFLLILDKPVGLLSQKSRPDDVSLTEVARQMLQVAPEAVYQPGVCNRLDRNTAGAVIVAKQLKAAQAVQVMLEKRFLRKYYWALVEGVPVKWQNEQLLVHGWRKDERYNKAEVITWQEALIGYQKIESSVRLLKSFGSYSLVEVELLTGKGHQIRAQLAAEGFPLLGDGKYNPNAKHFRPMLLAKQLVFENTPAPLAYLNGKKIEASVPKAMAVMLTD